MNNFSEIFIVNDSNRNGNLYVNGNLEASNYVNFYFIGNQHFNINGTANITNSHFYIYNMDQINTNGYLLLNAKNGFNEDIEISNTINIGIAIPTAKILGLNNYEAAKYKETVEYIDITIEGLNHNIKQINNSLYAQTAIDKSKYKTDKISQELLNAKIKVLTQLVDYFELQKEDATDIQPKNNEKLSFTKDDYQKIIDKINNEIKKLNNSTTVFNQQIDAVLGSILTSNRQQAAGSALTDAMVGNAQQAKNVVNSARESANNSNRQGAIQVINLANEMAISTRMIQDRNQGENSVWANAFGGANIIGSESEGVYGTTIGIDRQFSDAIFFGAYLTYADSQLNHNSLNQDSNNLQLGLYSRITNGQHEFDIKSYAQFSFADQERFVNGSVQKSDFTQTYLGASGNYGYVFDFSDSFSIKPLIGLNLYYSHTPDYTENGLWAQKVYSMDSFAASAEIGAEFRKGFDGGSYFYVTPKIEQFFATSGNDFKGHFTGSNMNYHVAGAEKDKTFGKILIGSNISVTDRFSIDLSVGAKQILGNKDDNTDETYLTGNIGVKYSF
ncbi:autotransporter outer membrane beta-barrel domain-containing protein [Campylobacter sp. RKI_CA19_01122]|uniref:autotransporter outer membrane beta-barrel domain-containing protein n=1 Tax=Campylobacter sp. RKI_CA19_01122 TaxID=2911627 RepID=UPI0021E8DC8D|nr:autotransporter outer membrane beta-barrel domain-containing protein [Campylobacter sp. RKI_CA19_01122]MCV3356911.1 autotransporter outer membrane beta-barrel domain-containing protein [Campylobacter sp. RKI_CA19_01122]